MPFLIAFTATLIVMLPVAEIVRTKMDRRALQERGVDIGAPWSGRCVTTRQVDLQTSPEESLQVASSAIVAIKGSGVVADRNTWSASGWTGTHFGAYGSQVAVFVTLRDPTTVRLNCYCRPRSKTTAFTLGAMGRRADRLVGEIRQLSASVPSQQH
jgi:hypothetical protein